MILDYIADKIARLENVDFQKVRRLTDFSKVADVESRIAFLLAKEKRSNPSLIAEDIASRLTDKFIEKVEAVGGYVNIWLSNEFFAFYLRNALEFSPKRKRVIIEYPSVNPNKPWHIGHLRNAVIGEAVSGVLEFLGYDVVRMNYINDLGLQVAQSFWYHKKFGKPCEKKFDHCIGREYVEAANKFEENEREVRETLKEMESGLREAREFVEKVVKAQHETARNYNIKTDVYVFESDVVRELLKEGLGLLKDSGIIEYVKEGEKAGCWVYKDKVLIRSDGTLTYTGKDVVFQMWKFGMLKSNLLFMPFLDGVKSWSSGIKMDFRGDWVINVIGIEQERPQKLIEEILGKFGKRNYNHLAYQAVRLKEGKFSGRKGTWIGYTADDLLKEAVERLRSVKELDDNVLRKLAVAAIKIHFLKFNLRKEIIFDWDAALNFEGDSGVYLMYTLVRTKSLLSKTGNLVEKKLDGGFSQKERALLLELMKVENRIEEFDKTLDLSGVVNGFLKAASLFNAFYAKHRILGSEEETKRVFIVKKTHDLISQFFKMIGVEEIEKM
jgi:arginyl-tRNA synthetase